MKTTFASQDSIRTARIIHYKEHSQGQESKKITPFFYAENSTGIPRNRKQSVSYESQSASGTHGRQKCNLATGSNGKVATPSNASPADTFCKMLEKIVQEKYCLDRDCIWKEYCLEEKR